MSSEIYSYLYEKLFELGALDVYTQSIYMKKNRPAIKLSVICEKEHLDKVIESILKETTTFGIRYNTFKRKVLERKHTKIETKYGNVSIKCAYYKDKLLKYAPEYEECKRIAKEFNIPLKKVYEDINSTFQFLIEKEKVHETTKTVKKID